MGYYCSECGCDMSESMPELIATLTSERDDLRLHAAEELAENIVLRRENGELLEQIKELKKQEESDGEEQKNP